MLAELRVKLAEVAPEATVTDAGTDNAALSLEKLTANPPEEAALFKLTVHVVDWPDSKADGEQFNVERITGATALRVNVLDMPDLVAVNNAVWFAVMAPTVAVKLAELAPAATVTLAGTVTFAFPLVRVTTAPPDGAFALSVTVHVEVPGAVTEEGVQESVLGCRTV